MLPQMQAPFAAAAATAAAAAVAAAAAAAAAAVDTTTATAAAPPLCNMPGWAAGAQEILIPMLPTTDAMPNP